MGVYLPAKFKVSSIILTGFRQGVILPPSPQNEPLKSPPRSGLMINEIIGYFECNFIEEKNEIKYLVLDDLDENKEFFLKNE